MRLRVIIFGRNLIFLLLNFLVFINKADHLKKAFLFLDRVPTLLERRVLFKNCFYAYLRICRHTWFLHVLVRFRGVRRKDRIHWTVFQSVIERQDIYDI